MLMSPTFARGMALLLRDCSNLSSMFHEELRPPGIQFRAGHLLLLTSRRTSPDPCLFNPVDRRFGTHHWIRISGTLSGTARSASVAARTLWTVTPGATSMSVA